MDKTAHLATKLHSQRFCNLGAASEECASDIGLLQDLAHHLAIAMDQIYIIHWHAAMMQHANKHLNDQADSAALGNTSLRFWLLEVSVSKIAKWFAPKPPCPACLPLSTPPVALVRYLGPPRRDIWAAEG